jgi:hypothetical protein
LLTNSTSVQDILSIVKDNLSELNVINVSTAFSRIGKMATQRSFYPRHLTADEAFQGLMQRTRDFARDGKFPARSLANTLHSVAKLCASRRVDVADGAMKETLKGLESAVVRATPSMVPQALANTLWAYATLGRAPEPETWRALETTAAHVAPDMVPQALANTLWAYATLGRAPEPETWEALETAAVRVAPSMVAQDLANTLWAYATLGRAPEPKTWRALETTAVRVAPSMVPQNLANTLWAYATLGRAPEPETWRALETAAVRVAPSMVPQALGNTLWAYATLGRAPEAETWEALETTAVRVAPSMVPQNLANTLWAYAMLGRAPEPETWRALETAAVRVAPDMVPQALANTVWAYTSLSSLRDVVLPSSYAAVWELVCNMEARDLTAADRMMLFHSHLMHQSFLSSRATINISTPPWLMVEARDAWMSQVHNNVIVSKQQRKLAQILEKLGVRHEVEHVTDDGYFSIDIYLLDHDIAVEFDGPSHFYSNGDSSSRTAKTELRDLFLGQRCNKVLTVPWFEFGNLNALGAVKHTLYVRELLAEEGIVV